MTEFENNPGYIAKHDLRQKIKDFLKGEGTFGFPEPSNGQEANIF